MEAEQWALSIMETMLSDMGVADRMFKPTNFWESGLDRIIEDIKKCGFENFKSHRSSHFFYVPVYREMYSFKFGFARFLCRLLGLIIGKKAAGRIIRKVDREDAAECAYRVFRAADTVTAPSLMQFSESEAGNPVEQFTFEGQHYSKGSLNYLRGLAFMKKHVDTSKIKSILELGGGYGVLGEILLTAGENLFYVNVDIPPLAAVSTYYLSKVLGQDRVLAYDKTRDMDIIDVEEIRKEYDCVVICPWQMPRLRGNFDLFVNYVSFQEMEPDVVRNYVTIVEKMTKRYVLLRNSKFGKNVARKKGEIGVITPLTSDETIAMFENFRPVARDSYCFGWASPYGDFFSEVICLVHNSANSLV